MFSSSTIDKMFGPRLEQNANTNFEPIFEISVNSGPFFEKSINFEHFVMVYELTISMNWFSELYRFRAPFCVDRQSEISRCITVLC